jgi:hypothetical protein
MKVRVWANLNIGLLWATRITWPQGAAQSMIRGWILLLLIKRMFDHSDYAVIYLLTASKRNMLSLMADNIELNDLQGTVSAEVLDWGTDLPEHYIRPFPDVILAADCVYFEPSFPLLETTLLAMTGDNTLVLMSYKRRRKVSRCGCRHLHTMANRTRQADKRFFQVRNVIHDA